LSQLFLLANLCDPVDKFSMNFIEELIIVSVKHNCNKVQVMIPVDKIAVALTIIVEFLDLGSQSLDLDLAICHSITMSNHPDL
jgi:hypothetical protein